MDHAERVARKFHDTYERLAPNFGYETRADTKAFDPDTPNGKLMIAVCGELVPAKETSSHVSTLASEILRMTPPQAAGPDVSGAMEFVERRLFDDLFDKAKTLAGSCMSQDETPGQEKTQLPFPGRVQLEHTHLSGSLDALTIFIGRDMPGASPHQRDLLTLQHGAMVLYQRILQQRLTDLENSNAG